MSYRDDRDALDRRVRNLEDDLRVAKDELAQKADDGERAKKIAAMDAHIAEARRELDRMGNELAELRGQPKAPKRPIVALSLAAAVVMIGAASFFALRVSRSTSIATVRPVATAVVVAPAPIPTVATPIVPLPPSIPAEERTTTVEWRGKVTSVKGSDLTVGALCTASAVLKTKGTELNVSTLDVICGGKPLYRSTDKLEGASMTSGGGEEVLDPSSSSPRYIFAYEDVGSRTAGRSQVSVDTSKGVGASWVEGMPAWRVEFSIDKLSQYSQSGPMVDLDRLAVRRQATVERIDGVGSPATPHANCAMVAYPYPGKGDRCIVRVSCGSAYLYGRPGEGLTSCSLNGAVTSATDTEPTSADGKNGDPMLELDVGAGTAVVSDGPENHRWSAHLKLTEPTLF